MKFIKLCLPVILLTACGQQKKPGTISEADSTQISNMTNTKEGVVISQDTRLYVGPIYALEETSEFYTPLYRLENTGEINFDDLNSQTDSLISKDENNETSRKRLPLKIARQYFNLTGIERISVYSKNGELVTDATLVRIELHEGLIESEYVAVFKPMIPSWFTTNVSYCTTASTDSFRSTNAATKELKDKALTTSLLKHFKIDSTKVWNTQQLQFLKDQNIYTVIATDPGSFLIETSGNKSSVLHRLKEDYSIIEIFPLSIEFNGKPMLLATMAVNETDMIWSALMVYNSTEYTIMHDGRIKMD